MNLSRRIARAAGPLDGAAILEIGPGPGGLTRALLEEGAARVVALEKDLRFLPALAELIGEWDGFKPVMADALSFPLTRWLEAERRRGLTPRIAANLPFNIASPLLARWLTGSARPASITVLLQREVADRVCASHGGKDYGRLSILCQALAETQPLFAVPKEAFTPRPKIDARLLRLEPRAETMSGEEIAALEKITAAAFSQRRKKLRSGLKSLREDAASWIAAADIDPDARPESLAVEDFCRLARNHPL